MSDQVEVAKVRRSMPLWPTAWRSLRLFAIAIVGASSSACVGGQVAAADDASTSGPDTEPRLLDTASDAGDSASVDAVLDAPPLDAAPLDAAPDDAPDVGNLSAKYPGDLGIDGDPRVVWAENFEEGTVASVLARYDEHKNAPGMSLVADIPAKSGGKSSMKLTAGGPTNATDFYKLLPPNDELFVRWYVKYQPGIPWHHSGMWFGGYAPPTKYPNPRAGTKPIGDDRLSFSVEPIFKSPTLRLDTYSYWMNMHSWMDTPVGDTAYYGNASIHQSGFTVDEGAWMCLEVHAKLNSDLSSSKGAVLEVWKNDALVQRFDEKGPLGYWVKDKFCPDTANGKECTDYRPPGAALAPQNIQLRSSSVLQLNHIWPQNLIDNPTVGSLWFDDMVVARVRVGCLR